MKRLLVVFFLLSSMASADEAGTVKVRIHPSRISVEVENDGDHPIRCRGSIHGTTTKGKTMRKTGIHVRIPPGGVRNAFLYYRDVKKDDYFNGGSAQFACHPEGQ